MAKTKSVWLCQNSGYESAKWLGKCPSYNSWNSFAEEVTVKGGSQSQAAPAAVRVAPAGSISPSGSVRSNFHLNTGSVPATRSLIASWGEALYPGLLYFWEGNPGSGNRP